MYHSQEEIVLYLRQKLQEVINIHKEHNSIMFISENNLFQDLEAETEEEKQIIRMLASSAIDGFNFNSYTKISTDLDDFEMQRAAQDRKKIFEPFLPILDPDYKSIISAPSPVSEWLYSNILSSGGYRNPDQPGPILTLLLIIFPVVIAFMDLGNIWYEKILKITAFILALSFAGIIYTLLTDIATTRSFYFKRFVHLILFLLFPLIIYFCIKVYFF